MSDDRGSDTQTPEHFVNTATAPRWLGTFGALVMVVMGLLGVWAAASNPIFGLGVNHPATLVIAGIIVCMGVGMVVYFWVQPDEAWRRVPDGPLSAEVRALADAGRTREAMNRLREETGAGMWEAWQVIDKYLAARPPKSARQDGA
jgi:hypothetical protein